MECIPVCYQSFREKCVLFNVNATNPTTHSVAVLRICIENQSYLKVYGANEGSDQTARMIQAFAGYVSCKANLYMKWLSIKHSLIFDADVGSNKIRWSDRQTCVCNVWVPSSIWHSHMSAASGERLPYGTRRLRLQWTHVTNICIKGLTGRGYSGWYPSLN